MFLSAFLWKFTSSKINKYFYLCCWDTVLGEWINLHHLLQEHKTNIKAVCVCVCKRNRSNDETTKKKRKAERESQKPETEIERGRGREGEEDAGKNLSLQSTEKPVGKRG